MGMSAIKKQADELLGFGVSHQQVFDQLVVEHPDAKPKRIAEHLRYQPSLLARERYRDLHRAMLAMIVISAALRVWRSTIGMDFDWGQQVAFVSLVPIASLLVGYTLLKWQGAVFQWVGWGNLVSVTALFKALSAMGRGEPPTWDMLIILLSVGTGAIALFLFHKAFPKFQEEKDPLGGPKRYVFTPDGAGPLFP